MEKQKRVLRSDDTITKTDQQKQRDKDPANTSPYL